MSWLIDTNVAIHVRDGEPAISARVNQLVGPVLLSVISRVELEGGVNRFPAEAAVRRVRLDRMLATLPVLDFDGDAAAAYRHIVEAAGYSRRKILDRMIAAQALAKNLALVTGNSADFRDIPGLTLVEW